MHNPKLSNIQMVLLPTVSAELGSGECIYVLTNDKEITEPSTTAEALQDPIWKKSMDNEMKALHETIPSPSSSPFYFCHISDTPLFIPVPLVSSFIPASLFHQYLFSCHHDPLVLCI